MMAEYQTSGVAFRIVPPGGRGWGDCPAIRCAPLWLHFRRHTGTRERPTLTIASASFGIVHILRSTWISRQYLLIFDDNGILRGDAAVVLVVVVVLVDVHGHRGGRRRRRRRRQRQQRRRRRDGPSTEAAPSGGMRRHRCQCRWCRSLVRRRRLMRFTFFLHPSTQKRWLGGRSFRALIPLFPIKVGTNTYWISIVPT
jgi:hypothetical protein